MQRTRRRLSARSPYDGRWAMGDGLSPCIGASIFCLEGNNDYYTAYTESCAASSTNNHRASLLRYTTYTKDKKKEEEKNAMSVFV